jgi:hypothetical protein
MPMTAPEVGRNWVYGQSFRFQQSIWRNHIIGIAARFSRLPCQFPNVPHRKSQFGAQLSHPLSGDCVFEGHTTSCHYVQRKNEAGDVCSVRRTNSALTCFPPQLALILLPVPNRVRAECTKRRLVFSCLHPDLSELRQKPERLSAHCHASGAVLL